jgi:FeS assembly SUF system protein
MSETDITSTAGTTGAANAGTTDAADAGSMGAAGLPLRDKIEAALRTVFDPEIPVNIYDLGLVYDIKMEENGNVKITMTLTAPACPAAGEIIRDVKDKVEEIEGVIDCHVQLTFDPAWSKEMMSEEAKLELGFF